MNDDDKFVARENQATQVAQNLKSSSPKDLVMRVKVFSPFKDYYDGQAFSITAENLTGQFDILPHHHNFISLLTASDIIIRTPSAQEKNIIQISISGGLIHVKADQVIVFLDI